MTGKNEKIVVRMAPSPTGALHVGTARTALFNYLFARRYGGKFIMRIEDTDKERSEAKWEKDITEGLKWLGIEWDEFYRQSERGAVYTDHLKNLIGEGKAFYCRHTKDELQKEREGQMAAKQAPRHVCEFRDKKTEDEAEMQNSIIRFKNDAKGQIKFSDLVRGEVEFSAENLGDFSIARSVDDPLYNFAVVIDDSEMGVSHIVRGEDHISNTPRQILILEALGFKRPQYAHIPLLLGADKSKLSKRHGATSVADYRKEGYLADAMFNFLAILGWKPKSDEEIMSREKIIEAFEVEDIQQAGAVFDVEKLKWMNGMYIRSLSLDEFTAMCVPYLEKAEFISVENPKSLPARASQWQAGETLNSKQIQNSKFKIQNYPKGDFKWLKKLVAMEQERIKTLSEIGEAVEFVFKLPEYDGEILVWRKSTKEDAVKQLKALNDIIENIESKEWTKENLESIIMPEAEKTGDRGAVLWPLRVAVSGKKNSPGPFEIMEVLGKEETIERVNKAINKMERI